MVFELSYTGILNRYDYFSALNKVNCNKLICYSTDPVCTVTILAMLRILNGQNPKPEDFHTVISVPKLPTCLQ